MFLYLFLNMLENRAARIADRLQFERNWTLQPMRQQLLRIADQKVKLAGGQRLLHQCRNANVIVLSLDDHFGEDDRMKGAGHEAPDEDVLYGNLGRT